MHNPMHPHGKVRHFEIPAADLDRAQAFYSEVFSWHVQRVPAAGPAVYMAQTVASDEHGRPHEPGAINGELRQRDGTAAHPLIVIGVPDLEEYLRKAERAGGKVVLPAQRRGASLYARIADPEGNIVALWEDHEQPA
jgi:predicted enzyme related to lactoylglutathione lyase